MLGLYYSEDGKKVTPCVRSSGKWYVFKDYTAYALGTVASKARWGKTYSLDALGYKTYDWVDDDGYNNLGTWVA